jgi:V/A-type H+-transporting ATPase subunit I
MLRPERMTSTSIICAKPDVEQALDALSSFGEFHIEQAAKDSNISLYNQSLQKAEESLVDIDEMIKKLIEEKTDFFDIFRSTRPTTEQITAENWQALLETISQQIQKLKKEVTEINTSLSGLREKATQLNHTKDMLTVMDELGADVAAIRKLEFVNIAIASLPQKSFDAVKTALVGFPIFLHRCYLTKEACFVCLATPSKYSSGIERILKTYHAEIFELPEDLPHDTTEAIKEVNSQLKANQSREKALFDSLNKLRKENKSNLPSWKEATENIIIILQAQKKILQSDRLATIKGFVPKKKFRELKEKIQKMLEGKVLVFENDIALAEDPPTKISHSRFVRPFEEITKLYGLPHYDEVDPTPVIAFTFPLIFGLMFADVGHGLILLVGGLTLGKLVKKNQTIKNMCWISAACGAAAIFAGVLFGEFFGIHVFSPLWFSPFDNVLTFLIFSLFVGVMQITCGLALEMVNFLLKRNVIDAVLTSLPKIAFYIGAVYLIAVYQLNFAAWFNGPILLILTPFIVLVFGKPAFLTISGFSSRQAEPKNEQNSLGQRFFEGGDFMIRLLSNTFSYSRILALLMAHWALIMVTYVVAGLVGSASPLDLAISGIIIAVGNVFVLALEGLIVFIHTLRLHFYEWFSKFYQGTGTEFNPLKQNSTYTKIVLQANRS